MKSREIVDSIQSEYRRYKRLAEEALSALSEKELAENSSPQSNSAATIAWHIAGNLASRFTDFLTTDGEKPWRHRESEFLRRSPTRKELEDHWEKGWATLFDALTRLGDADLARTVTIRGKALSVHAALHRSLAHAAYHVGQIVFVAKAIRGPDWSYLSIPPGDSEAYNQNPDREIPVP